MSTEYCQHNKNLRFDAELKGTGTAVVTGGEWSDGGTEGSLTGVLRATCACGKTWRGRSTDAAPAWVLDVLKTHPWVTG
jgi:hypothetical protein